MLEFKFSMLVYSHYYFYSKIKFEIHYNLALLKIEGIALQT